MPDLSRPNSQAVADTVRGHWAERLLPEAWKPYARLARLERPIGWWLLLWPCWWSSVMATSAAGVLPDLWHLALFLVGAVAMRGAGCTWNDILDRDLDARVARTRARPLASGQVTVRQALVFLLAQAAVGLLVLVQFNLATILLALTSLIVVAVYPLMKRLVAWPQLFLGIAFSWGALLGWCAEWGTVGTPAFLLYVGAILWVIGYDTIYAHQDREDDALIGLGSTARLFGKWTRPALVVLYTGATLAFAAAFAEAGLRVAAFIGVAVGAAQFGWQIAKLDINDPERCLVIFRSNNTYGWILFSWLIADALLAQT